MIVSLLLVSACSNKNIVKDAVDSEEPLGSKYGFTSFELIADTKEMKEALQANYDEKRDKKEAVYKNTMEEDFLHGDQAMEKLEPIFEELSFDPDMDDEDMIKKASKAFEIIDYKSLSLKIKFKGHDKKELKMTK